MAKTYANAKAALIADEYTATINGQIERIEDSQVVIIHKTDELGLTPGENDRIDDAALALDAVVDRGTPVTTIDAATTYTIQPGYYHGGSISYEQGGSDFQLQSKTVTPTKSEQTVGPDTGYYGLSSVTVNPIPEAYQDVTIVTAANYATAGNILTGKAVVGRDGNVINGSMPNRGAVNETLTAHKTSGTYDDYQYTIPAGYHNGSGKVSISLETISVTPSETAQTITPTSGKVIGEVSVAAINKTQYLTSWTSDATAAAGDILITKTAYVNGSKVTGSMPNNSSTWDGEQSTPIDHTLTTVEGQTSITVPAGYHNGYGVVKLVPEDKAISWSTVATPSSTTVTASSGHVLRTVVIEGKPVNWVDTTSSNGAAATDILASKEAYVNGTKVTGTISTVTSYTNDVTDEILASGASGGTLDTFSEAFYKNGGSITIASSLFARLNAI